MIVLSAAGATGQHALIAAARMALGNVLERRHIRRCMVGGHALASRLSRRTIVRARHVRGIVR